MINDVSSSRSGAGRTYPIVDSRGRKHENSHKRSQWTVSTERESAQAGKCYIRRMLANWQYVIEGDRIPAQMMYWKYEMPPRERKYNEQLDAVSQYEHNFVPIHTRFIHLCTNS